MAFVSFAPAGNIRAVLSFAHGLRDLEHCLLRLTIAFVVAALALAVITIVAAILRIFDFLTLSRASKRPRTAPRTQSRLQEPKLENLICT